jgi:hypothetical protein
MSTSKSSRRDDEYSLPPPPPSPRAGVVRCLGGCDKSFLSRDRCSNRVCPACARKLEEAFAPRVACVGTGPGGKPVSVPSDD